MFTLCRLSKDNLFHGNDNHPAYCVPVLRCHFVISLLFMWSRLPLGHGSNERPETPSRQVPPVGHLRTSLVGSLRAPRPLPGLAPAAHHDKPCDHLQVMLKELAVADASWLRALTFRALRVFCVQCASPNPAGVALCANDRHPVLLRSLPAMTFRDGDGCPWRNA